MPPAGESQSMLKIEMDQFGRRPAPLVSRVGDPLSGDPPAFDQIPSGS
jgi:hypothetical protein